MLVQNHRATSSRGSELNCAEHVTASLLSQEPTQKQHEQHEEPTNAFSFRLSWKITLFSVKTLLGSNQSRQMAPSLAWFGSTCPRLRAFSLYCLAHVVVLWYSVKSYLICWGVLMIWLSVSHLVFRHPSCRGTFSPLSEAYSPAAPPEGTHTTHMLRPRHTLQLYAIFSSFWTSLGSHS